MHERTKQRPTARALAGMTGVAALLLLGGVGCTSDKGADTPARISFPTRGARVVEDAAPRLTATPEAAPMVSPTPEPRQPLDVRVTADPSTGAAPLAVHLVCDVPDGPAGLRYRWDFGDGGTPVRSRQLTHTFQNPGLYTVTCLVHEGGVDTSQSIRIEVTGPTFDFYIETDRDIGTAPLMVEFHARVDDDGSGPFLVVWDFGDGGGDDRTLTRHTYLEPGEFTASAVVSNSRGDTRSHEITIQVDAPDDEDQ